MADSLSCCHHGKVDAFINVMLPMPGGIVPQLVITHITSLLLHQTCTGAASCQDTVHASQLQHVCLGPLLPLMFRHGRFNVRVDGASRYRMSVGLLLGSVCMCALNRALRHG